MTEKQMQERAQMEEAVDEMRYLIDLFEKGTVEEEAPGELENLRRILRDREEWLCGYVRILTSSAHRSEADIGKEFKDKLKSIVEGARMYSKSEAIEFLRSMRDLNHEPLRKVEQEWLDRIFVRDRVSRDWVGLAAVMATAEETGVHVENCEAVPCNCLDSVERKRRLLAVGRGRVK